MYFSYLIDNQDDFEPFLVTFCYAFYQGMLDNIEEQINDELNDELAKNQSLEGMLEDIQNDINEDLDKNDEEEIDTKANLHLEIGLLEVSDQQEGGSEEDFSR